MANALAIASDGSKPLKNNRHERYARLRAAALPRVVAFREAGNTAENDRVADRNSFRLERKPGVSQRIEYLVRQAQGLIAEKRQRIEQQLWAIHEADISDYFETVDVAKSDKDGKVSTDETGKMLTVKKQRPRLLSDLPPELRKAIEHVQVDARGNVVPQLYSKVQANQELRKMLDIGRQEPAADDVSRLSDAELLQQLAETAKELGINIDLNYSFAQLPPATEAPDGQDSQVIDIENESGTPSAADAADVAAAAVLRIAAEPTVAGARPVRAARLKPHR